MSSPTTACRAWQLPNLFLRPLPCIRTGVLKKELPMIGTAISLRWPERDHPAPCRSPTALNTSVTNAKKRWTEAEYILTMPTEIWRKMLWRALEFHIICLTYRRICRTTGVRGNIASLFVSCRRDEKDRWRLRKLRLSVCRFFGISLAIWCYRFVREHIVRRRTDRRNRQRFGGTLLPDRSSGQYARRGEGDADRPRRPRPQGLLSLRQRVDAIGYADFG